MCGKRGEGKRGRVGGGEGGILLLNFSFNNCCMVVMVSPWLKFKTSPSIAYNITVTKPFALKVVLHNREIEIRGNRMMINSLAQIIGKSSEI